MKRLLPLLLLILCACNDVIVSDKFQVDNAVTTRSLEADAPFSFDSVTDPAVWKTFQSLEEMQAACQVPEEALKEMSTEQLVRVCMDYPLYINYLAYNNEMDGINAVMSGFNGFAELKSRPDAAEALLSYYEKMNVEEIADKAVTTRSTPGKDLSVLHVGYLELILSSGLVPALYEQENLARLEEIRNMQFESKLRRPEVYSMHTVKKSLLLGARIKLQSTAISTAEKEELTRFVQMGGDAETPETYTEISRIVNR